MPHFRVVGDVHGMLGMYVGMVRKCEYSLQLGDMGFSYNKIKSELSPERHRILGGNHDNYTVEDGRFVEQPEHFLGDFGEYEVPGIGKIFFVRGGHSIDEDQRTMDVDWWPDEQMSYQRLDDAIVAYGKAKPDFVVSHECPESVIPHVSTLSHWNGRPIKPSRTALALENMLWIHRPKLWLFGHHHKTWQAVIDGTRFCCLNELECMDIEPGYPWIGEVK